MILILPQIKMISILNIRSQITKNDFTKLFTDELVEMDHWSEKVLTKNELQCKDHT